MKLSTYKLIKQVFTARLEGAGELTFVSNYPDYKDFTFDVDGDFLIEGEQAKIEDYEDSRGEVADLYRCFCNYKNQEGYLPAVLAILSTLDVQPVCISDFAGDDD